MFISQENAIQIAEELKSVTGKDINVIDKDGKIIGSTNTARLGTIHMGALKLILENLPILTVYEENTPEGTHPGINLPVEIDGETVGVIGITGVPEEVTSLGSVIKKMTEIMVLNMLRQEREDTVERAKNIFVENWLSSDAINEQELHYRSNLVGVDINLPRVAAIVDFSKDSSGNKMTELKMSHVSAFIHKLADGFKETLCARMQNRIVMLIDAENFNDAQRILREIVEKTEGYFDITLFCGMASEASTRMNIKNRYKEAQAACDVAVEQGTSKITVFDACSPELAVRSIPLEIKNNLYEHAFSGCSREEVQEICETLKLYYAYGGNVEQAAAHAFIHINSFYYRIKRIKNLTGFDLKNPMDSVLLYIISTFANTESV